MVHIAGRLAEVLQEGSPMVALGALLLAAYIGGRLANTLNLPRVSGYIITGMLLSPSVLGVLPERLVADDFSIVTDVALGIIAFSIGSVLRIGRIRKIGRQMLLITFTESTAAFLLTACLTVLLFPSLGGRDVKTTQVLTLALVVGALSAPTAPAAILGIVHEYRAKGPVTDLLLGIVTLDDVTGLLYFSLAMAFGHGLVLSRTASLAAVLAEPVKEVLVAAALAAFTGLILAVLAASIRRSEALLGVTLGAVFLCSGCALSLGTSPLMANMLMGFMIANMPRQSDEVFSVLVSVEEPILGLFFVIAGAHLDLGVFASATGLTMILISGRSAGKFLGAWGGARLAGSPSAVRRYLPYSILPQAGVTMGLVLTAKGIFPDPGLYTLMVNAVLGSVILNELISPPLVRYALNRSGEIAAEAS